MNRTTRSVAITALTLTLVAGACGGGQSGQEAALERLIEAETGEDIDLDLDGDGGFSVQTEDGSMSIDSEGNVVFDTDEGSGVFDADGDGGGTFTFDDGDGESGTVDLDLDTNGDGDGGFTVTDEDGDVVTGEVDGDGGFTVTGEDGESTFESGAGIPSQWPGDIPRPEGLNEVQGTYIADAETFSIAAIGSVDGDPKAFLDAYVASVVGSGWTETSSYTDETSASYTLERDGLVLTANSSDLGGTNQVIVSINKF